MSQQLYIIDKSVSDYHSILEQIPQGAGYLLLDTDQDGLKQLANYLSDRSNIDAIHLISHGRSGELLLGNSKLNSDSIQDYEAEFQQIGAALSESADMLLYGCNLADSPEGVQLLKQVSEYTQADIKASTGLTGSDDLGGNWHLEFSQGALEHQEMSFSYSGTLDGEIYIDIPDLIIQELTSDKAQLGIGEYFTVTTTVKNIGSADAASSRVRFYLSEDADLDTERDTYLGAQAISALAWTNPLDQEQTQLRIPSGAQLSAGDYYLIAAADADSELSESDETNNTTALAVSLGKPDYIVSEISTN
uniref:DUF4347 domain-containing protein n=1 Tax=Marinobacterium litorale TaxID=404770 RepID=UPI0005690FD4